MPPLVLNLSFLQRGQLLSKLPGAVLQILFRRLETALAALDAKASQVFCWGELGNLLYRADCDLGWLRYRANFRPEDGCATRHPRRSESTLCTSK